MLRWFKSWWEAWQLARVAKGILDDPETDGRAEFNAKIILTALAERKPLCRHCFRPYDVKPRSFAEMFQVRAILMLPDREPDPMLCDGCFETAVATYNSNATNVGTSNAGHPNMALQKLG